jgi:hypothetical protein
MQSRLATRSFSPCRHGSKAAAAAWQATGEELLERLWGQLRDDAGRG